ncbi:MAG: HutP family protein [Parabacteroides sp.]|nr:HutP family protein [Parabacteroides sp.]
MVENTQQDFLRNSITTAGGAAMLLALTQNLYDEERIKAIAIQNGFKVAVTEVGGKTTFDDFNEKITRAVIGACLNSGVINKNSTEIHAAIHATEEAKKGILVSVNVSANLALKVAIARDDKWIAVALFGKSALHYMTNHERAGLGIMHI